MSSEKKSLILYNYSKPNTYSYAGLMGFLDLYSEVHNQFNIKIVNRRLLDFFQYEANWEKYLEYNKIILLFSLFSEQFPQFTKDIAQIKDLFKENIGVFPSIIAGGPHCTARPRNVLDAGADIVVQGEGEYNLAKILNKVHENGQLDRSFNDIKGKGGVFYRYDEKIMVKDCQVRLNLNDCPSISFKHRLFGPIEISRGCTFNCYFCQYGNFFNTMKHKSVKSIVDTVRRAVEVKYDKVWLLSPNSFAYGSDGTNPKPKKIKNLLGQLSQIKGLDAIYFGTFPSEIRPDFVSREVLDSCVPFISNKYFTIGAQSASNRLLKNCNRGHSFEEVLKAVDLLKEYGFESHLDFIFGLPSENSEDIAQNLEFFKYVLKKDNIKIHTHTFMPLPGSKFENEPPGKVPKSIEKIIGQLIKEKKAYGQFQTQQKIGRLIENL
jgi:B12-binding domain/radical SAM domain protein